MSPASQGARAIASGARGAVAGHAEADQEREPQVPLNTQEEEAHVEETRELVFDDEWDDNEGVRGHVDKSREGKEDDNEEVEEPTRTLEFDDEWGKNTGVASAFGEFRDDHYVVRKHQQEEDAAKEGRLEEEARAR